MLKMKELDSPITLEQQLQDNRDEPVVLMILFTVSANDVEAFKAAWAKDAAFTKAQPGFISAQLHQGIGGSTCSGESPFLAFAWPNLSCLFEDRHY